jgi:ABC-type glycerol-3-phosphate transport system permease component
MEKVMEKILPQKKRKFKWFNLFNNGMLVVMAFLCLYPFLYILALSLSSGLAINRGSVSVIPIDVTFVNFKVILNNPMFIRSMLNSVILTAVGVIWTTAMTVIMAYPMSKPIKGGKIVSTMVLVTMLFSAGLIPNYICINTLKLTNTFFALWLPSAINVINLLLVRAFFREMPKELEEAARIDGCTGFQMFLKIVIPLSMPVIITISLFALVGYWNEFGGSLIYLRSADVMTLPVRLNALINDGMVGGIGILTNEEMVEFSKEGAKAAAIIISALPMILTYPFVQKYFAKGIMIGSIK